MAYNFTAIEKKWQRYWLENKTFAALEPAEAGGMPKSYVLDMFPYPSGTGLHVGHPEGYTATDITARYLRMKGVNVLHPMGWDAFGLPAEQYAIKHNVHPAETTRKNIDTFRRQIQSLGFSYDWDREVNTTDPAYYRWTQWIFLQLFNSYFDPSLNKAMPIAHLLHELENENYVVAPDGSIHTNPTQDGLEEIAGEVRVERLWRELGSDEQDEILDGLRLAYADEAPVNWCPGLGTVLANEEVIDGKSEVGGFPVERRLLRQWMLRITAYADRLIDDLDELDWPQSLKDMQRNWIGKSVGAEVDFEIVPPEEMQKIEAENPDANQDSGVTVFTTRPDTLFGATYLVLAPEHPLVDQITPADQQQAVADYRKTVEAKSDRERMTDAKDKTGVFTGAYAVNPVNQATLPVWISDYVLMGYGTGAIMAVPAHDERDFEFAMKFGLPMKAVVSPSDDWLKSAAKNAKPPAKAAAAPAELEADEKTWMKSWNAVDQLSHDHVVAAALTGNVDDLREIYLADCKLFPTAFTGDGLAVNSPGIDGLKTDSAIDTIIDTLQTDGVALRSVKYKLRDWLFSRQRYWGEPFPIAMDRVGNAVALRESELPLLLPDMEDFRPTGTPEPPLSKAASWLRYDRDGAELTRETNTMPQWAGSCWYYLRYIDPHNTDRFVDPEKEKYWMPVDLYVGGVEHAVLHLLYARFWHKVLFDLGHVSSAEPFKKLVNQGHILGETEYHLFLDAAGKSVSLAEVRDVTEEATPEGSRMVGTHRTTGLQVIGQRVEEELVEKRGDSTVLKADPSVKVDARSFKMSKSRGNVVNPDAIVADYGADTFRLYEMYLGPLEQQKPWNTRDIVGMSRFLSSVYRNLMGDDEIAAEPSGSAAGSSKAPKVSIMPIPDPIDRQLHRTIKKVGADIEALRFNTAIAELIKLNNAITGQISIPREFAETFTLLLAPFAPHLAEELWERLGHHKSLSRRPWPMYDEAKLVESMIELPVQIDGKLRDRITVPADATEDEVFKTASEAEKVLPWLSGKAVKKKVYVPKRLVNFVTA